MKNKIEDLRNHLFATLEALLDEDEPMALDRAHAVCEVGQTIINSAKAETEFLSAAAKAADSSLARVGGSGFIPIAPRVPELPGAQRSLNEPGRTGRRAE